MVRAVHVGQEVIDIARHVDDGNRDEAGGHIRRDDQVDRRVLADEITARGVVIGAVAKTEIKAKATGPRAGQGALDLAKRRVQQFDPQADLALFRDGVQRVEQLDLPGRAGQPAGDRDRIILAIAQRGRVGQNQRPAIGLCRQHRAHRPGGQELRFQGDLGLAFQGAGQGSAQRRQHGIMGSLIGGGAGHRRRIAGQVDPPGVQRRNLGQHRHHILPPTGTDAARGNGQVRSPAQRGHRRDQLGQDFVGRHMALGPHRTPFGLFDGQHIGVGHRKGRARQEGVKQARKIGARPAKADQQHDKQRPKATTTAARRFGGFDNPGCGGLRRGGGLPGTRHDDGAVRDCQRIVGGVVNRRQQRIRRLKALRRVRMGHLVKQRLQRLGDALGVQRQRLFLQHLHRV